MEVGYLAALWPHKKRREEKLMTRPQGARFIFIFMALSLSVQGELRSCSVAPR